MHSPLTEKSYDEKEVPEKKNIWRAKGKVRILREKTGKTRPKKKKLTPEEATIRAALDRYLSKLEGFGEREPRSGEKKGGRKFSRRRFNRKKSSLKTDRPASARSANNKRRRGAHRRGSKKKEKRALMKSFFTPRSRPRYVDRKGTGAHELEERVSWQGNTRARGGSLRGRKKQSCFAMCLTEIFHKAMEKKNQALVRINHQVSGRLL